MWSGKEKQVGVDFAGQHDGQHDGQHAENVSASSRFNVHSRPSGTIDYEDYEDYEARNRGCHDLIMHLAKMDSELPSTDVAMAHLGASLISMECVLRALRKDIAGAASASGVNLPADFDPESLSVLYEYMKSISGVIALAVDSLRSVTGVSMLLAAKDDETGGNPYLIDYFPSLDSLERMHAEVLRYRERLAADPLYQEVVSNFGGDNFGEDNEVDEKS